MISETIIKDRFITQTIAAGEEKIASLQRDAISQYLNTRTGALIQSISGARNFSMSGADGKFVFSVSILKYLRFQEIRANQGLRKDLHLYNRIVWGVLYRETLPELKYGLTDEIKQQVRRELIAAGAILAEKK